MNTSVIAVPTTSLASSVVPEAAPIRRTRAQFLERMTVRTSLWLAFASVLLGAIAIGVFSLFQMGRLNHSTRAIYEQEFAAGQAAEQARSLILRASRAQTQLLTATTAAERDALGTDIEASLAEVEKRLAVIITLAASEQVAAPAPAAAASADASGEAAPAEVVPTPSQQLSDALAGWTKRLRAYITLVKEQPLDLMQMSTDVPTADARLLNDTRKIEKIVDAMVLKRSESAQNTMQGAASIYQSSQMWVVGIMVALGVLSLVISGVVTRRLVRQLGGEPAYAKSIASRIAQGDLSLQIALDPRDTDSLLYSLRDMQIRLADTMREIADSSKQVANASREISMGNLDLSQRTEQQSASLEKTTTHVEQMAAIAKRHADSATHAAQLSGTATRSAQQGGDVVADVVTTMSKISKSTDAIHGNISVIEGIAFQTNILALNAAVEAAHAGEQGRGFAVVAAEVRSLAERSAKAAREINALIEASASQVKEGAALAQQAGQTIRDMAQTVSEVSAVMAEISQASVEQSAGIGEINQAVSLLDDSTQQNAALVEEAAAAAQSLDEQAQSLDTLVGRFRLI
jgi:methyl-accepting chemotaxis protein